LCSISPRRHESIEPIKRLTLRKGTNQVCLFRDSYHSITGASLAVYGLSTDSPKANTTFATKQSLPYPLICDPSGKLIKALGLSKLGKGSGTTRGVVVIDKQGHVRVHAPGGPQATLDVVLAYIKTEGMTETGASAEDPTAKKADEVPLEKEPTKEDKEAADTAAEVSVTAQKLDA
jgi:thioredoxin-dependent peroxiredoxin